MLVAHYPDIHEPINRLNYIKIQRSSAASNELMNH